MDIVTPPSFMSQLPLGLAQQPASAAPALQAGQIIDALVLALIDDNTVRLSLPGLVLDATTTVPLLPGSTVRLAVQGSASDLQLVIVGDTGGGAASTMASILPQGLGSGDGLARTPGPATIVDVAGAQPAPLPTAGSVVGTGSQLISQAVAQATQVAATRQGGLAPLLANVAQIVDSRAAPGPVLQAALDVLNLRVPLDGRLVAADVKQALAQSGLFLEARLGSATAGASGTPATASGGAPASTPATASGPAMAPSAPSAVPSLADMVALASGDLKAALLVFREVLKAWVDHANLPTVASTTAEPTPAVGTPLRAPNGLEKALPEPVVAGTADQPRAPPPPYRGDPPSAQPVAAPTLSADAAPADVAQRLLAQTDAALARHTLMQVASLPDQPHAAGSRGTQQGPQWLFEIPFMTPQGTSTAQFEIGRDGRAVTADGRVIWRARFSLNVEPMGPLHVQVALLGDRAAVTLWAEREASAALLRKSTPMLSEALRSADLEPGEIQCRTGGPVAQRPAAGRFLDQES